MHKDEPLLFPFPTREMLSFGREASLSLQISTYSTVADVLAIRALTKDGLIKVEHGTLSTGAPSTTNLGIHDIPIFLSVVDDGDAFDLGECYVKISLRISDEIVMQLAAGYVHQQKALSWPQVHQNDPILGGGKLKVIVTSDPAAGADWTQTVPENRTWRLISIQFSITTDANSGNRRSHITISDGTNIFLELLADTVTGLSTTDETNAAHFGDRTPIDSDNIILLNLPRDLYVPEGFIIASAVNGLLAGDNLTAARIYVEEFMHTN